MPRSSLFALAGLLILGSLVCGLARGEDFRIETQIFAEDSDQPVSENLTLFSEGVVYDFLSDPPQVSIFKKSIDSDQGRFILLDPARKCRIEITTEQVIHFTTSLRSRAAVQSDPLLQFASDPRFETTFDERSGKLTLASDVMNYQLLTLPAKSEAAVAQYREFTDWYARISSMLHVGSTPPFPRMAVNAALAEHKLIAREVRLTIPAHKPHRKQDVAVRSEHQIAWRLSREDRQRIEDAGRNLIEFKQVTFEQFLDQPPRDAR